MTTRGSRQGCRFGSVNFQRCIRDHPLRAFGEHQRLQRTHDVRPPWKHRSDSLHTNKLEPVPITDVTYVDDEAIFITGAHNEELVVNIKQDANMVDWTMSAHGMAVNWDPGKTEVIVLWAGKRTRACQHECNVEGVPGVLLGNGRVWRFVPKYKHLGSLVCATPSSAMEIRERIKKATRAFHALARKVFLQHETDIKLCSRLFNALVVSILLYNAETWVPT